MKLWRITQDVNGGYDTYDCAVVAAETEEKARRIHPSTPRDEKLWNKRWFHDWASSPDQVAAEFIGDAVEGTEEGVIVASFNAG